MKNNNVYTIVAGKEALEFCGRIGLIVDTKRLRDMKAKAVDGSIIVGDFKYTFSNKITIAEDATDKKLLICPVRIVRKPGPHGLSLVKNEEAPVCTSSWGQTPDADVESNWANGSPNSFKMGWGVFDSNEKKISSSAVRSFYIKELPNPIVFNKRRIASTDVFEAHIEYIGLTPQQCSLRTAILNYCRAMLHDSITLTDLDFIENKLFVEGFIYEDGNKSSSITSAYIDADRFMMKHKATHIHVFESRDVYGISSSGWGCNSVSPLAPDRLNIGYKNIYKLVLTLIKKVGK